MGLFLSRVIAIDGPYLICHNKFSASYSESGVIRGARLGTVPSMFRGPADSLLTMPATAPQTDILVALFPGCSHLHYLIAYSATC